MTTTLGGRPKVRTALLSAETRDAFVDAFGTIWNAYRQLGLGQLVTDGVSVSFPTFARACRLLPIAPEQLAMIARAWEARRRQPVSA